MENPSAPPSSPIAFTELLVGAGLVSADEQIEFTPLTGGVSSDIWLAETRHKKVCIKRALSKLKVPGDWFAPVERNAFEVAWMETAWQIAPGCCPRVVAHDPESGSFAMEYLESETYPIWKSELRDGNIDPVFAAVTGNTMAAIHAGTTDSDTVAEVFSTDAIFHSIRLEPYLEATADKHARVAEELFDLSRTTAAQKRCLVHGDVSPKNILVSAAGPKFLDAECAWYGDPAFDVAFCLNHMLLKCLWVPTYTAGYLACFDSLRRAYFQNLSGDETREQRTAALLPGLLLGRIDGKSPVEYITNEAVRDRVREFSIHFLKNPAPDLTTIRTAWENHLARGGA